MKRFLYSIMTYIVLAIVMFIGRIMYLKIGGGSYIDWRFIFAICWGGIGMCFVNAFDEVKDKYI